MLFHTVRVFNKATRCFSPAAASRWSIRVYDDMANNVNKLQSLVHNFTFVLIAMCVRVCICVGVFVCVCMCV